MKKIILFGLGLAIFLSIGYYQYGLFTDINYFTARSDIKDGKVEILTYGLQIYDDEEVNEVAAKYEFQYRTLTGRMVTQRFINQVDSYNAAVENYLDDLNGEGWQEEFSKDLEKLDLKK
jgi:hypothetical protein